MSSRNIIQIAALAAIACAGAITGVTLGVTDSGYAALPPATARDPAPPIPPPRWAEIMHRDRNPGWHSVGEYLDYLALARPVVAGRADSGLAMRPLPPRMDTGA